MAEIEYTDDSLIVHVTGLDKIWALKSQLTIPIAHVVRAEPATEDARQWWHGLRLPGTNIPGVITAGMLRSSTAREGCRCSICDRTTTMHGPILDAP